MARPTSPDPRATTSKNRNHDQTHSQRRQTRTGPLRWMWLNGLALVMFSAFIVFAVLQTVFGWPVRNEELEQAGQAVQSYWHYLGSGRFAEALFENWESEFLQMGSYILLTAFLVQRGSPESKPLDQEDRPEDKPDRKSVV